MLSSRSQKTAFSKVPIALRRLIVPFSVLVCFSFLLTFLFYLHRPRGLQPIQNIRFGWQAWDAVSYAPQPDRPASNGSGDTVKPPPTQGKHWWEIPEVSDGTIPQTLPLDIWDPLLPHKTGLTELAIESCIFSPVTMEFCNPYSSPAADASKGKWVRVERDLNWKTGLWYLVGSCNLYYRRTRRLNVPLITDLVLLPADICPNTTSTEDATWHRVARSIRNGVWPTQSDFLWYELGGQKDIITEIDVLWGEGPAWLGFEKLQPAIVERNSKVDSVWLTYRRGVTPAQKAPPLHFHDDGTFTILQIADLHYSVSIGKCRDTDREPCVEGDMITADFLARVLDAERPDMVVFSGDQLNGQGTSWDSKSVIAKFAQQVIDRQIPWAAIFGNHDDETDLNRLSEMRLYQAMPYCLASPGPSTVDGVGNYVLKVRSGDPSATHLLTLYFVDSGGYARTGYNPFAKLQYDWIKPSQSEWLLQESAKIRPIERPFTPDGASDLGHPWTRDTGMRRFSKKEGVVLHGRKERTLAKPNAMMWFHIPLQESFADPDMDANWNPLVIGQQLEDSGASTHNGNFFEDGILLAAESDAGGHEIKVVGHGHDHITDKCARVKGVWFCFGGGGSFSGYGKVGFDRRLRVYKISDYGETIRTYKHTEHDKIIDDVILVGKGAIDVGAHIPS
ncbi:Metallo-dependent phosphatase [Dacryopinax primogenitus]|uniref:Metallo-dependent phosphatase n=1 Tax=Dacryopinax primogenitus (strain DJM 731) TaxID=1858805 RepID=M5GBY2_DACPD|nr:Metallo-dependent phosphatase [Dacryopinax primogenitus]EJU03587.1 Metallo-dependent phosphatase [Dacryopinax primogenitus]